MLIIQFIQATTKHNKTQPDSETLIFEFEFYIEWLIIQVLLTSKYTMIYCKGGNFIGNLFTIVNMTRDFGDLCNQNDT